MHFTVATPTLSVQVYEQILSDLRLSYQSGNVSVDHEVEMYEYNGGDQLDDYAGLNPSCAGWCPVIVR